MAYAGDTDAGKGGGYVYQWTASALLVTNYLYLDRPEPWLPAAAQNALELATSAKLEAHGVNHKDETVELQDIVFERDSVRVQIQFKRASKIWGVAKVRDVIEHLITHRCGPGDYLVFMSDHGFHDDLAPLSRMVRTAAELEQVANVLNESRKPPKEKNKPKEKPKQPTPHKFLAIDLQQVFLQVLPQLPILHSYLELMLRDRLPPDVERAKLLVNRMMELSIAEGGSDETRDSLLQHFLESYSPTIPLGQWLPPELATRIQNIWAEEPRDLRPWQAIPSLVRARLKQLLIKPYATFTDAILRFALLAAPTAKLLSSSEWQKMGDGVGIPQELLTRVYTLAHGLDVSSSFLSVSSSWDGQGLSTVLRLADRLSWDGLGAYGRVPSTLHPDTKWVAWRCFFLKTLSVDLKNRSIDIVLGFPVDFSADEKTEICRSWREEVRILVDDFNVLIQERGKIGPVRVYPAEDALPALTTEDRKEALLSLGQGRRRPRLEETLAQPFVPPEIELAPAYALDESQDSTQWESHALGFEQNEKLAQALTCWRKAAKYSFLQGRQHDGFRYYVQVVRLLQAASLGAVYGRLPEGASVDSLGDDLDHTLRAQALRALSWVQLGELDLHSPVDQLNTAASLGVGQESILATLQLARLLILTNRRDEAEGLLLSTLGTSDIDFSGLLPKFLLLAAELYSKSLYDAIMGLVTPTDKETPEFRLTTADYQSRWMEREESLPLYDTLKTEPLPAHQLALALSNSQFFSWQLDVIYRRDWEMQSARIDAQRERTSVAWERLERAKAAFINEKWRDCLEECALSLDSALEEGDWGARSQTNQILCRLYIRTDQELGMAVLCAVRAVSKDLIEEACSAFLARTSTESISAITTTLLVWPPHTLEFGHAQEALSCLVDILTDVQLASAWNVALRVPDRQFEVSSSKRLIESLGRRVPSALVNNTATLILDELPGCQHEERRKALLQALRTMLRENASDLDQFDWTRLIDTLAAESRRDVGRVSDYQRHARRTLLELLGYAPKVLREDALSGLSFAHENTTDIRMQLGLAVDPDTAWQRIKEILGNLPDPVTKLPGYLQFSFSAGNAPQEALHYLPLLDGARQSQLIEQLCEIISNHDCLPAKRGSVLLALSQLEPEHLARHSVRLAEVSLRALCDGLPSEHWGPHASQEFSPFSSLRIDFGSITLIDRGAIALLGVLYAYLDESVRSEVAKELARAAASQDKHLRQGAAIALYSQANKVPFSTELSLTLSALIADKDDDVAGFAVRAAAIQISAFGHPAEAFLLALCIRRLDDAKTQLKRALALSVATLREYCPGLEKVTEHAYLRLSADPSFLVRKRLTQPEHIEESESAS